MVAQLTDDDCPALGSEGSANGLGQNIDTPQHALSGLVTKHDILACVPSASSRYGLDEPCGAGESGAGSDC